MAAMKCDGTVEWLMTHAGPIIRYRTVVEHSDPARNELDRLRVDLLTSSPVRAELDRLDGRIGFNDIHGSKRDCFENVAGILGGYGCRAGMPDLDNRVAPYLGWLDRNGPSDGPQPFDLFHRSVVASGLAALGYAHEESVRKIFSTRLMALASFASDGMEDAYLPEGATRGLPAVWQTRPVISSKLDPGGNSRLPTIYDIVGLAHYQKYASVAEQRTIGAVVTLLLTAEYQAVPPGYGVSQASNGRYYALGWDVKLPLSSHDDMTESEQRLLIPRLVLKSRGDPTGTHKESTTWKASGTIRAGTLSPQRT